MTRLIAARCWPALSRCDMGLIDRRRAVPVPQRREDAGDGDGDDDDDDDERRTTNDDVARNCRAMYCIARTDLYTCNITAFSRVPSSLMIPNIRSSDSTTDNYAAVQNGFQTFRNLTFSYPTPL